MTAPPGPHDPPSVRQYTPPARPASFVLGLVVGVVVGFGAGVLVGSKGCPPVPVPGATRDAQAQHGEAGR
jgi:hypothetical protein